MRRPDRSTLLLGSVVAIAIGVFCWLALLSNGEASGQRKKKKELALAEIPFDGARSYQWLQQICSIGRRISGTEGMLKQQEMVGAHFTSLGAKVHLQQWEVQAPRPATLANMIIQWHPEARERVLLCAHYDTRPFPDEDRKQPRGLFLGANDGASGVAVLCELAQHMPTLDCRYGVDFVLFDAEEFIFNKRTDRFFLGSEYFAEDYRQNPPAHTYRWGVLLDMVGDKDLQLHPEKNSFTWPDTRPLVNDIWSTAKRLGVSEFVARSRHLVNDDHLALRNIAGIPTCDMIDFDYPYWHTVEDTPDKCSPESLAKVGWVVLEWLRQVDRKPAPKK